LGRKVQEVVVDTYTLMAMVFGELTPLAKKTMLAIYKGEIQGLIPSPVAYEFSLQWLKGRIPGLASLGDVKAFLKAYFSIIELSFEDFLKAAEVKNSGDRLLAESKKKDLSGRRLSLVDSCIIVVASKREIPIVTGDKDLSYVASKLGLEVIW